MYAYFTKYCGNVKIFWKQIFVDINGNFFSGLWGHCFLDFLALLRIFLKYMYRFSLIIETVNSWVGGGGRGRQLHLHNWANWKSNASAVFWNQLPLECLCGGVKWMRLYKTHRMKGTRCMYMYIIYYCT